MGDFELSGKKHFVLSGVTADEGQEEEVLHHEAEFGRLDYFEEEVVEGMRRIEIFGLEIVGVLIVRF